MVLRKTDKSEQCDRFLSDVMQELYLADDDGLVENMEDGEKLQHAYKDLMRRFDNYYEEEYGIMTRSKVIDKLKALVNTFKEEM